MTSWLRGTSRSFLDAAKLPPLPAIGCAGGMSRRSIRALDAPYFDLLGRRLRRHIVVEHLRLRLFDMIVEDDANDDVLVTAEWPADAEPIAFADDPVWFGGLPVDVDLAGLTGAFGFRAGLEQARHVEPDVKPNGVVHAQM